ncbi:MAG: DUF87 domain-containing protein, partial [Candidatus Dormibacteraeota bacterium]|nr:DUF87 domain-containing protein [Candidatus Dormibacteraeota bacterium]
AAVQLGDNGLHVLEVRRSAAHWRRLGLQGTNGTISFESDGIISIDAHTRFALVLVEAYAGAVGTDEHAAWCNRVIDWLYAAETPAQVLTLCDHFDSGRAREAFDQRIQGWPDSRLALLERDLAGRVAEQSLGLRHYVVLMPGEAGRDGMFLRSGALTTRRRAISVPPIDGVLSSALRLATSLGVAVRIPDRDDIAPLLGQSVLTARNAAVADGMVQVGEVQQRIVTAVRLPPVVYHGAIVDALLRARSRGCVSLHFAPVDADVARRILDRRIAMRRYTAREGNDEVDNQVALADTTAMLAAIARRSVRVCRVALTAAVASSSRDAVLSGASKMESALRTQGFDVVAPSSPGLLPAQSVGPGGFPLARSLQITTEDVAACLVPMLQTPFGDNHQPLLGLSEPTATPTYLSVWRRPNHNAIVMGSSGAGKSVAVKTLLVRHAMEGAVPVVIDPDSEYRRVMQALGGTHYELGSDALNPLAPGASLPADAAAAVVLPVLSVLAGDDRGVRDGRPVRRLPDEDQGWLHREAASFFRRWHAGASGQEPLLRDLVGHIESHGADRALTERERERGRIITARLTRYTQGDRGTVFDRPSTFAIGESAVSIGLRSFAMSYGADLTPALAVVLSAVLVRLRQRTKRLIVIVDEAHRVTVDPDAGEVLGQLVRQARKYGSGVWMSSQRVEDFVGTDLGRTLAATAATKILMGVEEAAVNDLKSLFALHDEEMVALHPPVTGRAVVISGAERCVVRVLPGAAILAIADSSPESSEPVHAA